MKRTVNISRAVACTAISLYTVFTCYLCGEMAYHYCLKILTDENGTYYADTGGITREAMPYIAAAAGLILLGVISFLFLFRRGHLAACLSGATAVVSAILGMCTNTMLAEVMFARYTLGITAPKWGLDAWLSFKPMAAILCICAAVVYMTLCLIAYRKDRRCDRDGVKNRTDYKQLPAGYKTRIYKFRKVNTCQKQN